MNKKQLTKLYQELKAKQTSLGDNQETYTTGYRAGHTNGQIELLERILRIPIGVTESERSNP